MKKVIMLSGGESSVFGSVSIPFAAGNDMKSLRRRVTRSATLDGESFVDDLGFSHEDRTFVVNYEGLSPEKQNDLAYLVQTQSTLIASTDDGVFAVSPAALSNTTITLLVSGKES